MDFELIARQWLRALRGKRSQRGFSKRLGYASNIAYRWETGACFPTACETFALAKLSGGHGRKALHAFFGNAPPLGIDAIDLATPAGVAQLLRSLRGKTPLVELVRRSGYSRFSIARWCSGQAEPRLPELLSLLEATSFRLLDFLDNVTNIAALPSVAAEFRALEAARKVAYDVPWSHAVLRALELTDYARLGKHHTGWLARRLGIAREEEQRCLKALAATRQIYWQDERWCVDHARNVDTRSDPLRTRRLKTQWLDLARARFDAEVPGTFSYNLMAISRADFGKLRELHLAYFREMQALVADSTPSECVVLFNTQLFALDAGSSPG